MEFNAFIAALKTSLVNRGIDQNTADRYVTSVSHSFKEEDLRRIATYQKPSDFAPLSDNLAAAIRRKAAGDASKQLAPQGKPASPRQPQPAPQPKAPVERQPQRPAQPQRPTPQQGAPKPGVSRKPRREEDNDPEFMEIGENGKKIFWIAFACLSPLLLFLALAYLAVFAALYAAVAFIILVLVLILVLSVTGGSAVALVGLVYGVIRLFSIPAEGIYEIGLAVIIIGLIMLFGVLIYNLALRVMPLLFKQIKRLFLFTLDKLKSLFYYLKKECYKL